MTYIGCLPLVVVSPLPGQCEGMDINDAWIGRMVSTRRGVYQDSRQDIRRPIEAISLRRGEIATGGKVVPY